MSEPGVNPPRDEAKNPAPNPVWTVVWGALGMLCAFIWALGWLFVALYSVAGGGDLSATALLVVLVSIVIGAAPMTLLVWLSKVRKR